MLLNLFHNVQARLAIKLVSILAIVSAVSSASLPDSHGCNDPSRAYLEKLWAADGNLHDSIYNLRNMRGVATSLSDVPAEYVNIKENALGDSSCPYGGGSVAELTSYRLATEGTGTLCPSYDLINFDENRIPSTLFAKGCSCETCGMSCGGDHHGSSSSGSSGRKIRHARSVLGCSPVKYYVKVLRRVGCNSAKNEFVYKPVLEPLVVSCACDHQAKKAAKRTRGHTRAFSPPKK